MGIVGTILLVHNAHVANNNWAIIAHLIFGVGIITCMLSSTVYHYVKTPKVKAKLRYFDHASIYVLIAASYSPFTLILLREEGVWGWLLFILIWLIALMGIILNFRPMKKNSHIKTASYVVMGLTVVIAINPIVRVAKENNCIESVYWLITGGAFYIIGSLIYALAKREFSHAVFHIFVLLGLASHIASAYTIAL